MVITKLTTFQQKQLVQAHIQLMLVVLIIIKLLMLVEKQLVMELHLIVGISSISVFHMQV